jgi:acetolactate decarboxylase
MKLIIQLVILLSIYSCNTHEGIQVEHKGALQNIMHEGDISATANLKDFENHKGLYALGAVESLKGEILILDGVPYISSCEIIDSVKTNVIKSSFDAQAALLVYSQVNNWIDIKIPFDVITYKQLEDFIHAEAKHQGIDIDKPFPFLIEGNFDSFDWHVIDWEKGDMEHSHEKHIQAGLHGTKHNTKGIVLGFYSNKHHAIYTHHTTNMHLHIKTDDNKLVGHVDDLMLGNHHNLRLPLAIE